MDWQTLQEQCAQCQRCGLAGKRKNVVFGRGNPQADILLVGECPGKAEDAAGIPFVGLGWDQVYVTNLVKCVPSKDHGPLNVEQDACLPWLRTQTKRIAPKIIICLGRVAAQRIIAPEFKITQSHGQWFTRGTIEMTAWYHPSALLHDPGKGPDAFGDLKSLQLKLRQLHLV